MDRHNGMVEAIFLKWPHICKDYQSRGEAFCIWKLCLPTCFENTRARTSDISVILSKRQKYGKRKLKPHNGFPTPRKEIVACGLQNFFPSPIPEYDPKAIRSYVNNLKMQCNHSNVREDAKLIATLMRKTLQTGIK